MDCLHDQCKFFITVRHKLISINSRLVSGMNASSERLLSINYGPGGPLSIGQKCQHSSLLNGSIFLPHTSGGPASGVSTKRNSSSLAVDRIDPEFRHSGGTVVRFATIDSQSDNEESDGDVTTNSISGSNGHVRIIENGCDLDGEKKDGGFGEGSVSLSDSTTNSLSLQSYPIDVCDAAEQVEGDVFM